MTFESRGCVDLASYYHGSMPRHRRLNIPGAIHHVITGKELARYFGISRPSVSQAIKRGEKFAKEDDVKLLN
ncbi:MAG: hypothetical protein KAU41_05400 [Deltaproteobacteria bacterium]|nr:hypothetical protein [Deltaproteobacteria bacterium]